MIIGIPKEIKNHEYRVGVVPAGVRALAQGRTSGMDPGRRGGRKRHPGRGIHRGRGNDRPQR